MSECEFLPVVGAAPGEVLYTFVRLDGKTTIGTERVVAWVVSGRNPKAITTTGERSIGQSGFRLTAIRIDDKKFDCGEMGPMNLEEINTLLEYNEEVRTARLVEKLDESWEYLQVCNAAEQARVPLEPVMRAWNELRGGQ